MGTTLTAKEYERFTRCPVKCPILREKIRSLADYVSVLGTTLMSDERFWFRGHAKVTWTLTPSGLRYKREHERNRALSLVSDFKRIAEIKLERPPTLAEDLKWLQLAQHYGIPTRLLDWTESSTIGLYFACLRPEYDGLVFALNPIALNALANKKKPRILDAHLDAGSIGPYLRLSGRARPRGRRTIAINPVWNSERIMLQKGVFTLHGPRSFQLDAIQAPSLVAVPILREVKEPLRLELERIGTDEMTIFPELEHACRDLKRKAGLPKLEE